MSIVKVATGIVAAALLLTALAPAAAAITDPAHDLIPEEGPTRGIHEAYSELTSPEPDVQHAVVDHAVGDTAAEADAAADGARADATAPVHDAVPNEGATDGVHEVIDEAGAADPDLQHAVEDHLVPETQAYAEGQVPAVTLPQAVNITSPEAEDGVQPGTSVTITWDVEAIDLLAILYLAQVKAVGDESWTSLPQSYSCTNDPRAASGSCSQAWVPQTSGEYSIRVVTLDPLEPTPICNLGVSCDIVLPFYVDDAPPTVEALSIDAADLADDASKIVHATFTVHAAAEDLVGVDSITVTASNERGEKSCVIASASGACQLAAAGLLEHLPGGNYMGELTLTAVARDHVGLTGAMDLASPVDTSSYLVVIEPVGIPAMVQDGERISVTYSVEYALPVALAGTAAPGTLVTLAQDGTDVCTRTVPATGTISCFVEGDALVSTLVATGVHPEGHDVSSATTTVTWTSLAIERLAEQDLPTPSGHADPNEVYYAAFRVTTTHNGLAPEGGALLELANGSASVEPVDATGFVRVPVVRSSTQAVVFDVMASAGILEATIDPVPVQWTTVSVGGFAVDDDTVNVGTVVTFTAPALYEHDATPVETGAVAIAESFALDCQLLDGTGISAGLLTAVVSCDEVVAVPIPLVLTGSARGITTFTDVVELENIWTNIVVGTVTRDALVNVGDDVIATATATYAHDGSNVEDATLSFAAPVEGCDLLAGEIDAGALAATVTCAGVHDTAIGLIVSSESLGVTQLAEPLALDTTWTHVVVTNVAYDDFVNVGDVVTLTAAAAYHDGAAVLDGVVAMGAVDGCSLLSGAIVDGLLTATIRCDDVNTDSIPLTLSSAYEDVTLLSAPLALNGIWTKVVIANGVVDDAFDAIGAPVTFTADATYAHDGSAVPSAALVPALEEGCTAAEGAGIAEGELTITVTCAGVSAPTGTVTGLTLADGANGVNLLAQELSFSAVWTQIEMSALEVDDGFVNVGDEVTLSGMATWAHNDANVESATLVLDGAVDGCSILEGTVVDGVLSVVGECTSLSAAEGTTLPLVVGSDSADVGVLAAPLSLDAVWTQIVVSYTEDAAAHVLAQNAPVTVTATATFAHDGSPVEGGVIVVKSDAPADVDEFVCVTDSEGTCAVEVTKELGAFDFTVSAISGNGNPFTSDITLNQVGTPALALRWTAITFDDLMCSVDGEPVVPCEGATFARNTKVNVTAVAKAADTGEILGNAVVKLGGNTGNTNVEGKFSREFTRLNAGASTITARGVSVMIDGVEVTWTVPVSATLHFV